LPHSAHLSLLQAASLARSPSKETEGGETMSGASQVCVCVCESALPHSAHLSLLQAASLARSPSKETEEGETAVQSTSGASQVCVCVCESALPHSAHLSLLQAASLARSPSKETEGGETMSDDSMVCLSVRVGVSTCVVFCLDVDVVIFSQFCVVAGEPFQAEAAYRRTQR
jgi:hypothetical protein